MIFLTYTRTRFHPFQMPSTDKEPEEQELRVGDKVDIFWSRDNRYYPAIVTKVTPTHVDVTYDDGEKKTYRTPDIQRAARVC